MPLFEGHKDQGIQRLFIEIPDDHKGTIAYKWPDQQILQHSIVNVDLDYAAVFTNLGRVIGVLGPGRHSLDEGASLALGWLVDRLTGNAYYDSEVYFVTTREITNQKFGGPVDNLTDGPSGLVVSLRAFGELAFRVADPSAFLAKLVGTGASEAFDGMVASWVEDQAMAAIRAVVPDLVLQHGVLAMGQLQDATAAAAVAKANAVLAGYGVQVTTFAQLNVNLPPEDAQQLKQLAAAKAYATVAGDFSTGVRGEAVLEIAQGVQDGNVGAQPAMIAAGLMNGAVAPFGAPNGAVAPLASPPAAPAPASPAAAVATAAAGAARFCSQCGMALPQGARFCPQCGAGLADGAPTSMPAGTVLAASAPPAAGPPAAGPPAASSPASAQAPPEAPPGPGYWKASDGNWYPPSQQPGPG